MDNVLIIAEAGVNHNGDMVLAKELIDIAKESGADIVKFQSSKLDKLVSKTAEKASYQKVNTRDTSQSQYEMVKRLTFDLETVLEISEYSNKKGIKFLSTPFDIDSIQELLDNSLIDLIKIPSGEIVNLYYLEYISHLDLPVIMSTGMSYLSEIESALKILISNNLNLDDITILHCNTEYPTPMEDVNLKAMQTIGDAFKVDVGYSDHTLGIEVPIAAVAMGAKVIEKHFTIDRNMEGPDHAASLEPDELKLMVSGIRNIEKAISGTGIKQPSNSELKNIDIARKSLHTANPLRKGQSIVAKDIIPLRPGTGISPMDINKIIGLKVNRDISVGEVLKFEDFR